jgi:hypothetical protein
MLHHNLSSKLDGARQQSVEKQASGRQPRPDAQFSNTLEGLNRESGANPERTRRCVRGRNPQSCHWLLLGSGFRTSDHARGPGAGRFESAAATSVCEHFERPATPALGVRRGYGTASGAGKARGVGRSGSQKTCRQVRDGRDGKSPGVIVALGDFVFRHWVDWALVF